MWVYPNRIVEPHPNGLVEECELSGSSFRFRCGGWRRSGRICLLGLNRAEPARGGVHRDAAGFMYSVLSLTNWEQDGYRRGMAVAAIGALSGKAILDWIEERR